MKHPSHCNREQQTQQILDYLNTDLLCYQTDKPEALSKKQQTIWQPNIVWFEKHYDVKLETTTGLNVLKQPHKAHIAVQKDINDLNNKLFEALYGVTISTGSLILALSFIKEEINHDEIINACFLEEDYKDELYDAEKYGSDPLIEQKKQQLSQDLQAASLLRDK